MTHLHRISCLACFLITLFAARPASATTFLNLADTSGVFGGHSFTSFNGFAGLNNSDQVVFAATTGTGADGVFLADFSGSAPTVTMLVDDSGVYDEFSFGASFINDHGVSAVHAIRDDGAGEIFTINAAGAITTLVNSYGVFELFIEPPDINNHGVVVFGANLDQGVEGIFSARGDTPVNFATTIDATTIAFDAFFIPFNNNNNQTLYFGSDDDAGISQLVLHGPGGATPVLTSPHAGGPGVLPYDLNDAGDVVYVRSEAVGDARSIRVINASDGSEDIIADTDGGFTLSPLPDVTINASRQVAFQDGDRIVIGDASGVAPFLSAGDSLFGDVLDAVVLGRAFNDLGQFAFIYQTTGGVIGVAVADTRWQAADFDEDGDVDGDDFLAWQSGFGTSTGAAHAQGDADFDGDVDGDDFLTWQSQFGSGAASVSGAIPEPSCLALFAVLLVGLLRARLGAAV